MNLLFEQRIVLPQLFFENFVLEEGRSVLSTFYAILLLLVLKPLKLFLILLETGGKDTLLFSHNFHKCPELLIFLSENNKILRLQLLAILLRDLSVALLHIHFKRKYSSNIMEYLKANIQGPEASVINTILNASESISYFLRHSPIIAL